MIFTPPAGKPPLFIMLDGTGRKLARCFVKVRIWIIFPSLPSIFPGFSAYRLREAQAEGQYCTAEVAIALLDMAGDTGAAAGLGEHFTRFKNTLSGRKNATSG